MNIGLILLLCVVGLAGCGSDNGTILKNKVLDMETNEIKVIKFKSATIGLIPDTFLVFRCKDEEARDFIEGEKYISITRSVNK